MRTVAPAGYMVVERGRQAAEGSLGYLRTGVAESLERIGLPRNQEEEVLGQIGQMVGWYLVIPKRGLEKYALQDDPPKRVVHLCRALLGLEEVLVHYPLEFVGDAFVVQALRTEATKQGIETRIDPEYEEFFRRFSDAELPVADDVSRLNGRLSTRPVEEYAGSPSWITPSASRRAA